MIDVVGVDISLRSPGFVILNKDCDLVDYFCFVDKKNFSHSHCKFYDSKTVNYTMIDNQIEYLESLIKKGYKNFAIEGQSFGSIIDVWHDLYGVYRYVLRKHNCNYVFIPPMLIKKYLTGKASNDKNIISLCVYKNYGLDFSSLDQYANNIYDAFGCAKLGQDFYTKVLLKKRVPVKVKYKSECVRTLTNKGKTIFYIGNKS